MTEMKNPANNGSPNHESTNKEMANKATKPAGIANGGISNGGIANGGFELKNDFITKKENLPQNHKKQNGISHKDKYR